MAFKSTLAFESPNIPPSLLKKKSKEEESRGRRQPSLSKRAEKIFTVRRKRNNRWRAGGRGAEL